MEKLEAAVAGVAAAADSVQEVADAEAGGPLLGDKPVFAALPLSSILAMLREIEGMYLAELHVKRTVLEGLEAVRQRAAEHHDGGASEGRLGQHEALEALLQVHITAWMLDAEVDEARVKEHLELLTQDANSV